MTLVKIVKPHIVSYDFEYWSMHVAAALEVLHDHPGLAVTPQGLLGDGWESWSLADYRGSAAIHALASMRGHIQNWGTQYLLADALNKGKFSLREALLEALEDITEVEWISEPDSFECYVSGKDSRSGRAFLKSCKARIVGDRRRRVSSSIDEIGYADLCMLVEPVDGDLLAVFGEVEGNHGKYLLSRRYWNKKSDYALFGIGINTNRSAEATLEVVDTDSGRKIVLILGTEDNVIADFHLIVNILQKLMESGPQGRWWHRFEAGIREVVQYIVSHWRESVYWILEDLRSTVDTEHTRIHTLESASTPSEIVTPDLFASRVGSFR